MLTLHTGTHKKHVNKTTEHHSNDNEYLITFQTPMLGLVLDEIVINENEEQVFDHFEMHGLKSHHHVVHIIS